MSLKNVRMVPTLSKLIILSRRQDTHILNNFKNQFKITYRQICMWWHSYRLNSFGAGNLEFPESSNWWMTDPWKSALEIGVYRHRKSSKKNPDWLLEESDYSINLLLRNT